MVFTGLLWGWIEFCRSFPFVTFLVLTVDLFVGRLWASWTADGDDSDSSNKSEEMCQFFEKRGNPASAIQAAYHHVQQIDRQSAPQTSQKEKNDRIPFTLTFHPHNNSVKAIILNNFKILQNDPETSVIFSQPPLISFKRDKNVGNFLVRSTFKAIETPGTFKCARSRCKTCPFVRNADTLAPLIPTASTNAFRSFNLFLFFTWPSFHL